MTGGAHQRVSSITPRPIPPPLFLYAWWGPPACLLCNTLSAFRPCGVPGPTSKLSLRVSAQMGRRETEHKGEQKEESWLVLSCAQGRCACSRGLKAFAREREREGACPSARSPAWPPSRTRALDLPFIDVRRRPRCTMGGCSNVLTCLAERSQSPMYMPTWLSERC
jgi:hypothetical protein